MSQKRSRAQNYSFEDATKIIHLVAEHKKIIENKRTDGVTSSEKAKAWETIAAKFNSQTTSTRTGEQLRQKYDSLKKETRKYYAQQRQQRLQTGGGPLIEVEANPMYEKLKEIIKLSTDGQRSKFDSDATFVCEIRSAGMTFNEEEGTEWDTTAVEIPETTEVRVDEDNEPMLFIEPLTGSTEISWNKYSPEMLRTAKHPALNVNIKSMDLAVPGSSNDAASSISQYHHSDNVTAETDENIGERNRPLLSRRKPTVRRSNFPLSASGKKLEPWVSAKKKLAELQMKLLQKQYEEAQRREEVLFLLRKKDLELDIQIKEERLKNMSSSQ